MYCNIRVAKTKALISLAVTAKLICVFVFAIRKKNGFHITRLIFIFLHKNKPGLHILQNGLSKPNLISAKTYKPHYEKISFLHMRKQRRRSASW